GVRVAEEEALAVQAEGPERAGAGEDVRAALRDEARAVAADRAVLPGREAEGHPPRATEVEELGDLEVVEVARLGDGGQGLPGAQVVGDGVPDDAAPVERAVVRAGGEVHVEAARRRLVPDPRVAPRLLPHAVVEALVPAGVGLED